MTQPMFKQLLAILALGLASLACLAEEIRIGDDYVRQGDTVFVRQGAKPFAGWNIILNDDLNPFYRPTQIKTVVFVNMGNVGRWLQVGHESKIQEWMKAANVTTIVVGACENYCAVRFAGGAKRLFAQGAFIDLKAPVDFETKKLETRFPAAQFAMLERKTAAPGTMPYKDVFFEAFTKSGMTGSTRFAADTVQFCEDRETLKGCKSYDGLDAYKVGLITDPNLTTVKLPEGW